MRRILVVGGAGYVGSVVTDELVQRGYAVRVLDRLYYDQGVLDERADVLQEETARVAPRAPYSLSKYQAEQGLLALAADGLCPVILRKGTVYGYSPRMRYDLVVNTFVRDALAHGQLTLHHGGEMWRPLVDVRDAARAYVALIEADEAAVRGEIFNLCYQNLRISELAIRVRESLRGLGVKVDVRPDYHHGLVRNYRVSSDKIGRILDFRPKVSIEDSVTDMVQRIGADGRTDFENPRYSNIRWLQSLEDARKASGIPGSVLDAPTSGLPQQH
jgi:nucleoside-diphosphate-sugar epimerase